MSVGNKTIFQYINWHFLILLFLLFCIGVANLYSASAIRLTEGLVVTSFYKKQMVSGLIGCCALLLFMIVDYKHLKTVAWPLFFVTLFFLILVPLIGVKVKGAQRWLDFGIMNFQPAEMAKISIILLGANFLSKEPEPLGFQKFFIICAIGVIPALMIIMQPDLGSGLSVFMILGGMIFYRGVKWKVLRVILLSIPIILPISWFGLKDYQKERVISFVNPSSVSSSNELYQVVQAEIAFGSGQFFGKGFLQGTQSTLRFLPEKHTDFAIAVFGEEWGFFGSIILLALFCGFLYQIAVVAKDAKDLFGSCLAAGVFFYFFLQIFINIAMVLRLMPVVGIPLPFISYGGTALLMNLSLAGLVLNVSMRRFLFK